SLAAGALGQYVLQLGVHAQYGFFGGVPVDAGIGNRYTVAELGAVFLDRLVAPAQVAFDHPPDDGLVAFDDLVGDVFHHQRLQRRVLVGVGVAAVDHDVGADARLAQFLLAQCDADRIVVGLAVAAAQHHVAVAVALGG